MGLDKWVVVKERVSKEQANSMFNFKEGLKRKALKVQYFKHPELAHFLYDRFLAAYGRLPWNNEVPNSFVRFFDAGFFLGMKPELERGGYTIEKVPLEILVLFDLHLRYLVHLGL